MSVHFNDELAQIIGTTSDSTRIRSLIWLALAQHDVSILEGYSLSGVSRSEIASKIRNAINARPQQEGLLTGLLPDIHLAWIEDGERQSAWLIRQLNFHFSQPQNYARRIGMFPLAVFPLKVPHHLRGRNRGLAFMDYFSVFFLTSTDEKLEFIRTIRLSWEEYSNTDQFFSWLEKSDSIDKIRFFWNWLTAHVPERTHDSPQFRTYDDVLMFFDGPYFDRTAKELFNKKARDMWAQKHRRENSKGKKQCNFVLPVTTVSKLENLASKYRITRTDVIDLLINAEARTGSYMRERFGQR